MFGDVKMSVKKWCTEVAVKQHKLVVAHHPALCNVIYTVAEV
jgi:hypothetical protein